MGNLQSANISCTIQQLDELQPGDTLHGFVRLTIHADTLTLFEGIDVTIAGVELAVAPGRTSSHVVPTGRVFKLVHSIANFEDDGGGTVTKGDYIYPFEVALPSDGCNNNHHLQPTSIPETILEDPFSGTTSIPSTPSKRRQHGRMGSDTSMLSTSSISFGGPPGMTRLDSLTTTASSMSDSEISTNFSSSSMHYDHLTASSSSKMVMYKVRASLRRKPKVPLTVDTDIKCIAECVEA